MTVHQMLRTWLALVIPATLCGQNLGRELSDEIQQASRLVLVDTDARIVRGLTYEREALRISVDAGTIGFAVDHQLRTRGAVINGKGSLEFLPPTRLERENLRRLKGDTLLRRSFSSVVLVFGDSTRQTLERFCQGPGFGDDVRDPWEEAIGHLGEEDRVRDPVMIKTFGEGRTSEWCWVYVDVTDGDPMVYVDMPFAEEEVRLSEYVEADAAEVVSSFHHGADYERAESERFNAARFFRVDRVTIDGAFSDQAFKSGLLFEGRATLAFRSFLSHQRWLPFYLTPDLEVDSVTARSGRPLRWYRTEDARMLWVETDTVLGPLGASAIAVSYRGTLVERDLEGFTGQKTAHYWYPRYGGDRAVYDLTFRYPSRLRLAAVGDRVSIETVDGVTTSRWVTPRPVHQASFNIGLFQEYEIRDPRIPPVTVYLVEDTQRGLLLAGGDARERVAADVANSILFFQNWFGKPPTSAVYATEIPYLHGEAFPGLLHLSWITFEDKDEEGADQAFRAHEVAHQWWGIGVTPRSYHDQWLAEGLSEYCGWWYFQLTSKDNAAFLKALGASRRELLRRHRRPESEGRRPWIEPSPLWFGYRTASGQRAGDHERMVYQKGAWIVHMLRNMTLDLKTFDESIFRSLMRDFYTTYAGKSTGTEEFREVAERNVGTDLRWFFDQWVYGSSVPTYRVSWNSSPVPGGAVRVALRVRQERVPEGFRMWVPVKIELPDNKVVRTRIMVDAPDRTYELPEVPEKPLKVVVNDLESVLCDVVEGPS